MLTYFRTTFTVQQTNSRLRRAGIKCLRPNPKTIETLETQLEDLKLNAIADERAEGPFVKVSLDDL